MERKDNSCRVKFHTAVKEDIKEFEDIASQACGKSYTTEKVEQDEKLFESESINIRAMLEFLKSFATKNGFKEAFINDLLVVGDEMFSNICKYAYKEGAGNIFLKVLYDSSVNEFMLMIIDEGIPFNPFAEEKEPISGDIDLIQEGGLGILIVKQLMSEYNYDYIDNKNVVILKKKL